MKITHLRDCRIYCCIATELDFSHYISAMLRNEGAIMIPWPEFEDNSCENTSCFGVSDNQNVNYSSDD